MDPADKKTIIMYTTSWCPDCHRSKYFLERHGIEFIEIDVEEDDEAMAIVKGYNNGIRVVPTIIFPDGQIFVEPSNGMLAAKLEINVEADSFPPL